MENHERMLTLLSRVEALSLRQAPLGKSDLTFSQFALLICIGRMPGSHANDIAETMNLTPPTISVALRRLEEGGWLRREPDPKDRRATHLYLTEKASDILLSIRKHRDARISAFLNALTQEEQGQLLSLLEKATINLDEN